MKEPATHNDQVVIAISQAMQRASAAYSRGEWAESEAWCRQILAARADYFDALNLLGIIAAQTRRVEEAARLLGCAVAADPSKATAHNNYGNVLKELKRFGDALESYERALKVNAEYAEAYFNRGGALRELRRFDDALDSYERAVKIRPGYGEAYFSRGVILQELGRFEDALDSYQRALKVRPDYVAAYNNLGNTLRELKRFEEALDSYERALNIKPDYAEAHHNRGVALQELQRFEEALGSFEQALKVKPDFAEAYNHRGNALRELSRFGDALHSYDQALKLRPDYAEAYNNRGVTLKELKRFEDALESFERALQIEPGYAEAYFSRGVMLQGLKRFTDALDSYERAFKFKPEYAEAYLNRGVTLQELKRFTDALDSYEQALEVKPEYPEAYLNRGAVLQELKRSTEALGSYERALKLRPDYAEAHHNRGNTLRELGRFEDALHSYERALRLKPDYAEAYNNRGVTLEELKRFEEALDCYERALKIQPDYNWLYGAWLHARMHVCDWNNVDFCIGDLIARVKQQERASPPFVVLALIDSLTVQRQAAQTWVTERYPGISSHPSFRKRRGDKIRIGYYSADYRNHATAYLMAELFERHDKSRFELVAISYGPDIRDDMRMRLSAAFDRFLDVRAKTDGEVASLSRDLAIDIAVDLKGFTQDARTGIFSSRAAPIQVNYLGYPGTMGASFMDYLIADQTLIPLENREHYAEKIVYLPNSYQVNDRKRQIADREFARAELGLPSTSFVFCCFNNSYKITADMLDCWMRILKQVEGSVLWLFEENKTAADNLRKEAQARDVNAGRLIFARQMPLAEHLARHRAADLFIDTLPYNAHTTASDALWAGLPVLTCIGESFAARVAASLLNAVGLPELITTTQAQYEAMAIELASNPARLAALKEKLCRNRLTTPLFDTERFARHLEDAYMQMYQRYQADLSPEDIHVAR